jgi:hypothetical protein
MDPTTTAWLILILGYLLPLAHVALSPRGGPWSPPPGARCPFGPRTGWLVMVLLIGPLGWLLYLVARARRSPPSR